MNTELKDIFKGKLVIVGIGNVMKKDDGFGPALINRLKNKVKSVCIDAGSVPENYTKEIAIEKPDIVLLVDIVDLGKRPGEYGLLKKEDILKSGFTTHNLSPNLFIDYLETQTDADIYVLGVQPEDVSFGDTLSDSLNKTLNDLEEKIKGAENA